MATIAPTIDQADRVPDSVSIPQVRERVPRGRTCVQTRYTRRWLASRDLSVHLFGPVGVTLQDANSGGGVNLPLAAVVGRSRRPLAANV